ncbi:hypothetical protein OSH39_23705, partial [Mycobacterium ulcerans]|nr:hypothetical protein [Mycobacterium ulcerans]MEB3922384.1 hypothetical protein [Mycobacterium ulcerans]MEB3926518.1 hypothetical protein [Mycobacterium ulcerans]MEB3955213.1 hypothetical protein [Mycobacterium ulcerans]MEB3988905.1 hypothetical protein [Mycobacterium ulcerans]
PPPRPPQSTIPQLTSLLINNAGALAGHPRQWAGVVGGGPGRPLVTPSGGERDFAVALGPG